MTWVLFQLCEVQGFRLNIGGFVEITPFHLSVTKDLTFF